MAAWMLDVLGRQAASAPVAAAQPARSSPQNASSNAHAAPSPDLQSRLATIARNIEALETKVTGDTGAQVEAQEARSTQTISSLTEPAPTPIMQATPAQQASIPTTPAAQAPAAPSMDPLEALRRRKMELEGAAAPQRAATQPADLQPANLQEQLAGQQPESAVIAAGLAMPLADGADLSQLSARFDEQFSRLTQAIGDVRQIAEAGTNDKVRLDALESYLAGSATNNEAQGAALADLSQQVRAVRDAITSMPAPDAIKSLEDGYNHVLTRLDTLKSDGASDQKIDALYEEVTGLRELLDELRENGTASVVEEMRAMLTRLDSEPSANSARIAQALEAATSVAEGQSSEGLNDAIGAVVERLVALEARIEALAAGDGEGPLTNRLDAIQSEMSRLATFQDEAKGLSQALDAVRDEVRSSNGGMDWSALDQRFGALDRIEQMTGGYADQISSLSERLSALDGTIANQGDMARQVSALSRQMETFTNAMPVREIEQAVLELTGRVTSLQEDTGTERLAMAVRELGERVESCIRSIPKTDAIVEAVEAKIEEQLGNQLDARMNHAVSGAVTGAMEPVINRLDTLHTAMTEADGPLIEHMAGRLEALISAMPTPRAEDALAALEQQLSEINQRQANADVISRDDVTQLYDELTRARASVELGSNSELQRAIVDQVRHLADRFENARASGDATILPEVEEQIEALAARVQSLGLFEAQTASISGVDELHDELTSLRRSAGDQDQRMQQTLENVQQSLETVAHRITALESDDKAALNLAGTSFASNAPAKTDDAVPPAQNTSPDSAPMRPTADLPAPVAKPVEVQTPAQVEEIPAPGDAQDLLRQLTGAINGDGKPATSPRPQAEAVKKETSQPASLAKKPASPADATSQRASFIAAARRAAQSAALQATAGNTGTGKATTVRGAPGVGAPDRGASASQVAVDPSLDPFAPNLVLAGDARTEPKINTDNAASAADQPSDINMAGELGGTAKTNRVEQKKKKEQDAKRQKTMSRAMAFALVLFTIGLGLIVVTLILPSDRTVEVAPLTAVETPADLEAQVADEAADVASTDPRILPTESGSSPVRSVGQEVAALDAGGGAATTAADVSSTGPETIAAPAPSTGEALGSGFERDRGPVMAQTPDVGFAANSLDAPAPTTASVLSLGPLSGLSVPALPPATANALPEAIGSPRLRVAASGGDSAAQFEIATRYMEGRFVPQDFAAAAHWYGLAADQGSVPAAYRLGSFYEQGRGVDRETNNAIAWYEQSARGGNPRAMHNLAVMAAEGRGLDGASAPDFERASGWFRAAADHGLSDSQFNLAVLFARGMGVERDLLESYKWFALAANAGDSEAVGRRDEVAGVLGEEALALARARVDNWQAIPIDRAAVEVVQPEGGWDDEPVRASSVGEVSNAQAMIARAQALLAQRGYEPGPADGLIGPRTTDAVRAFRQSVGLGDTDTIDEALLNALSGSGNL